MFEKIDTFLNTHNLDIRVVYSNTRNKTKPRFSDQKVKIDNLRTISDIVLQEADSFPNGFTKNDIWFSESSKQIVTPLYSKPNLDDAENEYDKFFAQPLKMLGYSKVLDEYKSGNVNYYKIHNKEILNYISLNNRNSFHFACSYFEKVLFDSEMFNLFEDFFESQDNESFKRLKTEFIDFLIRYTRSNTKREVSRIFNPMLNILSFKRQKKGTNRGYMSRDKITWAELMYNRENWRDVSKPKNITRQEHYFNYIENRTDNQSLDYEMGLATRNIKEYHNNQSEINDELGGEGVHAHHIFPKVPFPLLRGYKENIILLTPTQHYNEAHLGSTRYINPEYQIRCLLQKIKSVERSYDNDDGFYSKEDLVEVLNSGYRTDIFSTDNEFDQISNKLIDLTSTLENS